ncbi:glycosyltransferase [Pedobacter sp. MC2016-24]|nr:glycosyltransferase [Pedobacter sp. MC2016-24]
MVTVVIVTYNASKTLQRCLNSIYSQIHHNNIQIVVIDGKSNDSTIEILNKNSAQLYYWASEPDQGIYHAMNKSLLQLNTPWVYFIGADDALLPDFSKLIEELEDPSAIYYGNVMYKEKKCSGLIPPYQQAKLGVFHQSIIYPTSIFKKYKYDTRYPIAADYALNMQLHKDPDYHFEYRDLIIANYNHTGISATNKDLAFEKNKSKIILKNFGFGIWARYMFRKIKAHIALKKY